ncbi:hypothetical protein IWQ60_006443 [Tieghemiomyces parasiticus]|uniref:T-cell immunomodulatory protein TIP C2 domain-containing protein n=1 Tax=Tieghemiomyces parasiticus TaxID=78921 RepID=A0A9W8A9X3_9FUNG|nr:hypothetical protein IWQ60_006443 [Tieghemiomyces parasiticus]
MDADGAVDLVFATCDNGGSSTAACGIHVVYNQQKPLCKLGQKSDCRPATDLCSADADFQLDVGAITGSTGHVFIPLADLLPGETLVTTDPNFHGALLLRLQLGDFNYDGFPDLMVTTRTAATGIAAIRLLQSVPCSALFCTPAARAAHRRSLAVTTSGVDALALPSQPDAQTGAPPSFWSALLAGSTADNELLPTGLFFDLDDDGTLDVVALTSGSAGGSNPLARTTQLLFNNFFSDAFFAKTLLLNGVCLNWCSTGQPDSPRTVPYGVNYPGASLKYTIVDNAGTKHAVQVAQLPQSNYMARLTPYNLFGLGRTNNYIEELAVGSTYNQVC